MSKSLKIGWIGTGIMGGPMCQRIIDAGYETYVYNRTKHKALRLINSGARWCESPLEIAHNCDIVFTIVGLPSDVREIYLGEDGLLEGVTEGDILIDMTTSEPSLAVEIYNAAKSRGASSIDAPVSGGDIGAREGRLSIMVGGDAETVERVMPFLRLMGTNIVHQGGPGKGQHAKMCNQIMVAGEMIGMCETLLYAYQSGLDLETMLESVGKGAASCWMLDNLAPRIIKEDYRPGFMIEHFIKDMSIALKESERMGIKLPGLSLVKQLYEKAEELGHGRSGTQALILALKHISNEGSF